MTVIRSARLSDEDVIYSLVAELEEQELDRESFELIFRENLSSPDIRYLVAEENGLIAGFVSVHFQRLLHHVSLVAEVQELIVTKEARGRGLGAGLLAAARAEAEKRGCTRMEVCCNKRRTLSHAFYESQGLVGSHYKFCISFETK